MNGILEIALAVTELAVALFFFGQLLKPREMKKYIKAGIILGVAAIHAARSFIPFATYVNFGITLILWGILVVSLFRDSIIKKLIILLIYFAVSVMCDSIARLLSALVLDIPYTARGAVGIHRYIFNAINICLYFAILSIFSMFIKKHSAPLPVRYRIMLLLFPLFGLFIIISTDMLMVLAGADDIKYVVLLLITVIGLLYFNITVFGYIDSYSAKLQLKAAEEMIKRQEENYRLLEMNEQELRILRHNICKHMAVMQDMIDGNNVSATHEFMQSLKELSALPLGIVYTNDITLDSILNVGCKKAAAAGIRYIVKTNGITAPLNISPADMSTVLCNVIDNAVEAADKTDDKFIVIDISSDTGRIRICTENSSLPIDPGSRLLTTKKDIYSHGFGITGIKRAICKYNGHMDISYSNGITKCVILTENPKKRIADR